MDDSQQAAAGGYDWNQSASAPADRPVRILDGAFYADRGRTRNLGRSELLHNGWGETSLLSSRGSGGEPLPSRLTITWFSLADDRFYGGDFELPVPRLQQLFETGFSHPVTRKRATWTTLLIGLAPGGLLVLWVTGGGLTVEVCHFVVPETAVDWAAVPPSATSSRADWVRQGLLQALGEDGLRRLAAEGPSAGRWFQFRQRYPWRPLLIQTVKPTDKPVELPPPTLLLYAVNGEREFITNPGAKTAPPEAPTIPAAARALPRAAELRLTGWDGIGRVAKIQFDHTEIHAAFTKLHNREGASPSLSLHFEAGNGMAGLRLYVCDELYSLELLMAETKIYRSA